ncbi:MAG: ACP phosphodiesterase [Pseudomonadota bacterium]|nr:MAG: ACP phosphodiesterase [Pseudomonadota bacterium]
MNYLAHLYLSGDSEDLLVGNFIGDSVRGDGFDVLSAGVQDGVRLHRYIDRFTDTHPVVRRSKKRMWHQFGRYSSVVADVFFDHFLAQDWHRYHPLPLAKYSTHICMILKTRLNEFPERSRRFLNYMAGNQVLPSYASISGIGTVLAQMAGRARFESKMEYGSRELRRCYSSYRKDFQEFFPELRRHTEDAIRTLDQSSKPPA